ncbi:hypothetical protein BP5796_03502 [Coleophoma crateriformis]|uniref:Uncharacterized protein n=1 Tax=Coleophoma crateriformis TaxID=565419 RepID=A0A3D8SPS9_9HELO|nr:hypothetical protein BP5796_03502 [Coleophoma crateriformis]
MAETTLPRRSKKHNLQPLETNYEDIDGPNPGVHTATMLPLQSSALPSPSVLVAREYYRDHAEPGIYGDISPEAGALAIDAPRRHSAATVTKQLSDFSISSPASKLPQICEDSAAQSKDETPSANATKQSDLMKVSKIATRTAPSDGTPTTTEVLGPIPFQYTHDRLRTWGHTYLGNTATADAFINVVHLRRPSLALLKEGNNVVSSNTTIRARVIPKDRERKPFLIQKQFDVEELRSNIPPMQHEVLPPQSNRTRQSLSGPSQKLPSGLDGDPRCASPGGRASPAISGAFPIHIEYALHYLPALAALMLSGHVRKGDSIDIPIPHAGAWKEVMLYIYTGEGPITSAVRENVLYLGGRVDE